MYSGYKTAFHGEGSWCFYNYFVKNVVFFCVDKSSLSHTDQKNDFLGLGEGDISGINGGFDAPEKHSVLVLVKERQNST